ncbi:Putative glycosyl transferase [Thermogutta terrifontis]|jgi:glycosyltransferase involved in cell wall biosynthesis|uniref:Glycosyl transferase n=1 Tax=Thermogutta terrifontis TaxID=1331910 RepID=A0A286RKK1_9BACT|nr:glycosyltransferase family 2 protein [Thermogutta terrifontis]ASV76489.1 Putative glycosyl transferase [Thermogutta terrifontis]
MPPRISVVIPVYNGAKYLREALASVMEQTYKPFEIIVVDDGSTDGSADIAKSFAENIIVLSQANRGESAARNLGINAASGDWIAFLDADDIWHPKKLERQSVHCTAETDCIHTNFFYFGICEGKVDVSSIAKEVRYSIPHVAVHNPFRISSVVIRKDLPVRFPEWTQDGEDLLFFLDLCLKARIRLVPEFLTGYRVHEEGQSRKPDMLIRRFAALIEYFKRRPEICECDADKALTGFVDQIARQAVLARYTRRWDEYRCLKRFLKEYDGTLSPLARQVRREMVGPQFLYTLKDAFTKVFRG